MAQKKEVKKKSKNWIIILAVIILVIAAMAIMGGGNRHTLPCGMKISFSDSVRNDVTGKWRLSTTSDSYVPSEHAIEYYNEMFKSDDEIHFIWNATLKTTTRITAGLGLLYVDTFEYVNGEEHDAKIMPAGTLLTSKIFDITTGKEITD